MKISELSQRQGDMILTTRKTTMEFNRKHWAKTDRLIYFNIIMEISDSFQVNDLVVIYILNYTHNEFP